MKSLYTQNRQLVRLKERILDALDTSKLPGKVKRLADMTPAEIEAIELACKAKIKRPT